uniref:DNA polymerase III subunit alpha n=1 Tax=Lygus hesperus TaxID=30085 RepID=A0A0A9Y960_LYGHE
MNSADGSQTEPEFEEMLAEAESGEPISRLTELLKLCDVDFPVHCLALFASRRSPRSSAVWHMLRVCNIQHGGSFWLVTTANNTWRHLSPLGSKGKQVHHLIHPSYPPIIIKGHLLNKYATVAASVLYMEKIGANSLVVYKVHMLCL